MVRFPADTDTDTDADGAGALAGTFSAGVVAGLIVPPAPGAGVMPGVGEQSAVPRTVVRHSVVSGALAAADPPAGSSSGGSADGGEAGAEAGALGAGAANAPIIPALGGRHTDSPSGHADDWLPAGIRK